MVDADSVRGHELLRRWLSVNGFTHEAGAARLQTTVSTLRSWLFRKRRPSLVAASVIEAATGSMVTRNDWLSTEEVAQVRAAAAGHASD